MPYAEPADDALSNAYQEVANQADVATTLDPSEAIDRLEAILKNGSRRVGMAFLPHTTGPWPPEALDGLRATAVVYAAEALHGLRTCVASGAIAGTPMPTSDRLPSLTEEYATQPISTSIEFAGAHPDEILIDQFGTPLTEAAAPILVGGGSERELIRSTFSVIRSAVHLVAAIDDRPELMAEYA